MSGSQRNSLPGWLRRSSPTTHIPLAFPLPRRLPVGNYGATGSSPSLQELRATSMNAAAAEHTPAPARPSKATAKAPDLLTVQKAYASQLMSLIPKEQRHALTVEKLAKLLQSVDGLHLKSAGELQEKTEQLQKLLAPYERPSPTSLTFFTTQTNEPTAQFETPDYSKEFKTQQFFHNTTSADDVLLINRLELLHCAVLNRLLLASLTLRPPK